MPEDQKKNIAHPENDEVYKALKVNSGIEQPPAINPHFKKTARKRRVIYSVSEFVEGITRGNISILSQAVTLVESNKQEHYQLAQEIIEKCLPFTGNSVRIGITGVPGAGKSTFIEALGMHIISKGGKLAVLAIDPSSERTKGSILGDKTRMESLSVHPNAYIRPSPSAGTLGGVARKTRESIILCEAAGFNTLFIETVGVGQSETAVHSMVDFFLLLMIAGAGDELQGIKRGIMEMADAIAINKADGDNIKKAEMAKREFSNALHLFPASESGWAPRVKMCSSLKGDGIEAIWEMVQDYLSHTKNNLFFPERRKRQSKYWMYESINEQLKLNFYTAPAIKAKVATFEKQVLNEEVSSFIAAKHLLDCYFNSIK